MQKWPKDLRKGDVIVGDDGTTYEVVKVVPIFGGSWFDVYFKGHPGMPVAFGGTEKVDIKVDRRVYDAPPGYTDESEWR